MNIIEMIEGNKKIFSKSELKVANHVINTPIDIEHYTITKIAELTSTSKSAVLRFCQKLGFKGYSEFRYEMIRYLHSEESNIEIQDNDIFTEVTNFYSFAIDELSQINRDKIKDLAFAIKNATQVFSFGVYKSGVVALKLKYNLIDCGKPISFINDLVTLNHSEYIIDNKSLLIIFSISGISQEVEEFLKVSSKKDYNSYLITCSRNPKLKKYVKNTISIPLPLTINKESFDGHALLLIFVEILTRYFLKEN